MPITFAQAEPMIPSITAGAGAAEYAAKTLPSIYSIFENAARLRASGGGGGGGGAVRNDTGIQVLPNGDGGAGLYQVESQANREQRAADLGFEAQVDPVAKHIEMQQNFKTQQAQQAQAYQERVLKQLNGDQAQQPQQPPPVMWSPNDKAQLDSAGQAVADLQAQYEGSYIGADTYDSLAGPAQQKYEALTQKKQAYDRQQEQQQLQQQSRTTANQDSLAAVRTKHVNDALNGVLPQIDDIPGMPKRAWKFDDKGVPIVFNEKERLNHQTNYYKMLETQAAAIPKAAENAAKLKQAAEIHETKMEQSATKGYMAIRQHEIDRLNKEEEAFMKGEGNRVKATPEGFDNTIAERMKAHGFPGTIGEFVNDWKSKRGQSGQSAPSGQSANPPGQAPLAPSAKPEAVAEVQDHVSTMPRLPTGQPDLLRSSPEQLDKLRDYYAADHKSIGVTAENAAKWVRAIDAAKEAQGVPAKDFEHAAPATNRFARGASNIAGETPEAVNRIGRGAERVGKVLGIDKDKIAQQAEYARVGAGVIDKEARSAVGSVVDRIERGGANTYDLFKRWLGK